MPVEFHDINSFFFHKKKKPAEDEKPKKRTTGVGESQPEKKEPIPAQVRFVSAKFEPHSVYGYAPKKEAVIIGSVEFINETKISTVTLELFAIYNSVEENLKLNEKKYCTTEINKNKKFKFAGIPLEYHNDYPTANNKDQFNDPVTYKAIISHSHHEKPLEVTVKFPDANAAPVDLKKGMYDSKAHNARPGKYPADPEQGYIEGTKIYDLQQMLEALHYMPKGSADGAFGEQTEAAVKEFQSDSNKKLRLLKGSGTLIELSSITFTSDVYGIVNKQTRDELMIWKRDNYLRPIPELYEHDFDSEATDRQIKSRNETGFFEKGKPILSVQKHMQKVGVYVDCTIDGWFGPKMKEAVGIFQDAAATGKFVVNGIETELEEKLTGFRRGVLDVWTQVHMKKVAEKGGKISTDTSGDIVIKKIELPNESISFTTKDGENEIRFIAELKSSVLPKDCAKEMQWELEDDPDSPGTSDLPKIDSVKGDDVKIKITLPKKVDGRNWEALKYRIRAKLVHEGKTYYSTWSNFGQDEKDMLRQQYIDMSKAKIPERSEFKESGKSDNFSLAEGACNCGKHTWHLWTVMSNLDDVRSSLDKPMQVNSGYRCPLRNKAIGGKPESRHQYGDAADIAAQDFNGDNKADRKDWDMLEKSAKEAGATYTEGFTDTGTWVHMDWR